MAYLRALTPCSGFVDLQQPGCSGQAGEIPKCGGFPCSCADHQRSTSRRSSGRAGPTAHMLKWGSVQALKISWAPQDLALMEHVQQAWLFSQAGYLHFMCVQLLWSIPDASISLCLHYLGRNPGQKYGNPAFNTSSTRGRGNEYDTTLACSIFTLNWLL